MEEFETDDKLIDNKEEKNQSTITFSQFLLIAVCSAISLCALYFLFKTVKAPTGKITPTFDISK